jgi:hypothetical protein
MAKQWAIKFTVQSRYKVPRAFPMDMLSYDSCYPSSDGYSVGRIIESMDQNISAKEFEIEPITLIHLSHGDKNWKPTNARWDSFGYKVTNIQSAKEY